MFGMLFALLLLVQDLGPLLDRLSDDRLDVRNRAVDELSSLPLDRIPELKKRLDGLDDEARGRLLQVIARIEDAARLLEFLPPYRPVSFAFQGQPAKEAIEEWSALTGFRIDVSALPPTGPVTIRVEGRTPLEALQELAREAKVGWEIMGQKDWLGRSLGQWAETIRIHPMPPDAVRGRSLSFVRHYRIDAGIARRNLVVGFQGAPGVRPYSSAAPQLTAALDDQGRDLRDAIRWSIGDLAVRIPPGQAGDRFVAKVDGDGPLRLSRLSGRIRILYPREILWMRFEKPEESVGRSLEHAGRIFVLEGYRRKTHGHEVKLTFRRSDGGPMEGDLGKDLPFPPMDIEVLTADGRRLHSLGYSASQGQGQEWTMSLDMENANAEPASEIRFPRVERFHEDIVDFDFRDLAATK